MFQPVLPSSGLSGWRLLQRTYETQTEYFNKSARLQRDTEYFRENISNITTAEELVDDHRLLSVALGAFGLDEDIGNKYFIKKMLEEGTIADDALSNRFTDTRYRKMVKAFGFGPLEMTKTSLSSKMEGILEQYQQKQFQIAVGEQDETYRIALYAQTELLEVAQDDGSEKNKWFTILGQPALRKIFEGAFGLPSSFVQLDIDKQLEVFEDRAEKAFGSNKASQFHDPEAIDTLITRYLAQSQINNLNSISSSATIALSLLQ